MRSVATPDQILRARDVLDDLYIDERVEQYIVDLVLASRNPGAHGLGDLEPLLEYEIRFVHDDGRVVWVLASAVPQHDEQGNVTGWIGSLLDVTHRRQAADQLHEFQRRLREASRLLALGELTGSIAHELNQPLTAIGANVSAAQQMLKNGADPNEIAEILADIREDNQRAAEILRGMRALVRPESAGFQRFDLVPAIGSAARLLESEASYRGAAVEFQFTEELPAARGNVTQLQQVLVNLVTNALDAMAETEEGRRRVIVSAASRGGEVWIAVRDFGPGFDPNSLEDVFAPLFTTRKEGLGFGLAICRRIVEAHGGRIWAENHPGGGGLVQFTLPADPSAES